jgi:hypothetical protein
MPKKPAKRPGGPTNVPGTPPSAPDTPAIPPDDPRKGYGALGAFIGRHAPYGHADLPDGAPDIPSYHHTTPNKEVLRFGLGDIAGDAELLAKLDPHMGDEFADKRVVAIYPEPPTYVAFNADNQPPPDQKADDVEQAGEKFLRWEFGDAEPLRINKAIRIQYTHKMADDRECTAFILIGYTGESH